MCALKINHLLNSSINLINRQLRVRSISFRSKKDEKEKSTVDVETEEQAESLVPVTMIDEVDMEAKEAEIEQKRNRSGLLPQHRNMLMGQVPYETAESWIHQTVKYKRMMYGRYGESSGVDPATLFPSKAERQDLRDYELVAFPHTLQEMISINKKLKREKELEIVERENAIAKKMEKLDQWKNELQFKIAKKEADAKAAKDRKDRLIEEVRRQLGFKVDTRDEKFKEALEAKEREDKKKMKEEKRKVKEENLLKKLVVKTTNETSQPAAGETSS